MEKMEIKRYFAEIKTFIFDLQMLCPDKDGVLIPYGWGTKAPSPDAIERFYRHVVDEARKLPKEEKVLAEMEEMLLDTPKEEAIRTLFDTIGNKGNLHDGTIREFYKALGMEAMHPFTHRTGAPAMMELSASSFPEGYGEDMVKLCEQIHFTFIRLRRLLISVSSAHGIKNIRKEYEDYLKLLSGGYGMTASYLFPRTMLSEDEPSNVNMDEEFAEYHGRGRKSNNLPILDPMGVCILMRLVTGDKELFGQNDSVASIILARMCGKKPRTYSNNFSVLNDENNGNDEQRTKADALTAEIKEWLKSIGFVE